MTAGLAGLAVGLSAGLGPRYPHIDGSGLRTGLEVAIANTIAVGLAFGFVRAAYGKYALARWWLACRGDLRWRLMAFLLGRSLAGHRMGVIGTRTGHGSALIACLGKSCNVQFVVRKSGGMPEAVNQ
jgi:hypothetical protein